MWIQWLLFLCIIAKSSSSYIYFRSITIDHNPSGPFTKLYIKSVQVHDEETYTCAITYLDPSDACESSGSYKIKLNVLGWYLWLLLIVSSFFINHAVRRFHLIYRPPSLCSPPILFFIFSRTVNNPNARWKRNDNTKWNSYWAIERRSTLCQLLWGAQRTTTTECRMVSQQWTTET